MYFHMDLVAVVVVAVVVVAVDVAVPDGRDGWRWF